MARVLGYNRQVKTAAMSWCIEKEKRRFRRNEVKTETEFLYDSQRRLFMRFAQLEQAHYACACTDVRVSLAQCVSFCTDTATGKNTWLQQAT